MEPVASFTTFVGQCGDIGEKALRSLRRGDSELIAPLEALVLFN